MERPDKNRVLMLLSELTQSKKQIEQILQIENDTLKQLKTAYEGCRLLEVQKILVQVDVEELNKDKAGIRIGLLKDAGLNNIADVLKLDHGQLTEIRGIGDETADKILRRAEAIRDGALELCVVQLSLEEENPFMPKLILNLARTMNTRQIYETARIFIEEQGSQMENAFDLCKKMTSSLRWFAMLPKQKTKCVNAYEYLNTYFEKGFVSDMGNLFTQYMKHHGSWDEKNSLAAFQRNSAPFYAWLEKMSGRRADTVIRTGGINEELARKIESFPLNTTLLKAILRSYQEFGTKYILHQKRVLLGDEMGLGKTIQALGAMTHLAAEGRNRFLVVCPVSVKINWLREIENKSELKAMEIHGDDKYEEFEKWQKEGGIAVTTYETLTKVDVDSIKGVDLCIVDEAHMMKNPNTLRTKAMQNLLDDCEYVCMMSGTPLENKVEEMAFLIENLRPKIASEIREMKSLAQAKEFRNKISPVYLRRVRDDVLKELPEKTEIEDWCEMTPAEELAYYKSLKSGNPSDVRRVSFNVADAADSTKAKRLWEIVADAKENGHKVLVFSFFLETLNKLEMVFHNCCCGVITGAVPADKRQEIVDTFTEAEAGSVLLSQIVAGGVGLNIQAANVVVLCEPQWKPSIENQAISRAYRMGQVNHVFVHRLLTKNSVDEHILEILYGKSLLFQHFANESAINEATKTLKEQQAMKEIVAEELKRFENK